MTDKLIPDALASALQTLVSVTAISTINFSDRTFNAALGTLVTVLWSLVISYIQQFTSWKQFVENLLMHIRIPVGFLNFSLVHYGQKVSVGPTDFNPLHIPRISPETTFKHMILIPLDQTSMREFYAWGIHAFGAHVFLGCPSAMDAHFSTKSLFTINKSLIPAIFLAKDYYFPIWRSKDGTFVYLTSKPLMYNTTMYALRIESNCKKDLEDVMHAVNEFTQEERKKTTSQQNSTKALDIYKINDSGDYTPIGKLSLTKTFDHLFFEQKDELIRVLTRFRSGKMYADHLGEDNKLGILLFGPPGTGKSACMAAICNFLRRKPVIVTGQQLLDRKVMDGVFKNHVDVVIMDEFDCLLDVIRKRDGIMGDETDPEDTVEPRKRKPSKKFQLADGYLQMAKEETDASKKERINEKIRSMFYR